MLIVNTAASPHLSHHPILCTADHVGCSLQFSHPRPHFLSADLKADGFRRHFYFPSLLVLALVATASVRKIRISPWLQIDADWVPYTAT